MGQNVPSESPPETKREDLIAAVSRLAALTPLEYELVRECEAHQLGVRVSVLDKEVTKSRADEQKWSSNALLPEPEEIWPESVDGAELLDELVDTICRFIICDRSTAITAALWIAFTWFIDRVQVAPLAVITAPEKRCGKSQLLALIGQLSRRPLFASNISSAAVYRVIEKRCPTLLVDEADSFLKDNEELRGVINSGHTRQAAYVLRTVGDNHEPCQFSTWGAKAISGIGHLSETVMDRAVVLELRRKLPEEKVDRLRHAESGLFKTLASKLARFAEDAGLAVEQARPVLPERLNDRAQDNWEPLLAIADHVGGGWPSRARDAALSLSGVDQESLSLSAELLRDIREAFEHKQAQRMTTAKLLESLNADEERPWATYNRGSPMTPRQLAKRLADYHIKSHDMRFGHEVRKGYELTHFADAFDRYLSSETLAESATTLHPSKDRPFDVADVSYSHPNESPSATPRTLQDGLCSVVAHEPVVPSDVIVEVEI